VPLPPEAEQERIVSGVDELLSVARHSELDVHRSTERLTRLRQSILKWAFEGKLVDQDPNDEPVSVLIERIKADREAKATERTKESRRA
jgi:type I restriction enzyme S subunit